MFISNFQKSTLGLGLNCLQCNTGENFPDGFPCEGNENGTSVLCPEESDTCMKSTCRMLASPSVITFKGCARKKPTPPDTPCRTEVNIFVSIYFPIYFKKDYWALALNQ